MLTATHKLVYPNLTWLECFYYNMATVSTVGFGDYSYNSYEYFTAGMHYVFMSALAFLFSMGTVASVIGEINDMIMEKANKMRKFKSTKRKHEADMKLSQMKNKSSAGDNANKTEPNNDVVIKNIKVVNFLM